jgi:hypothetical protein
VKLQNLYAFNWSRPYERTREIESESSRLNKDIAVLSANLDITPHPHSLQIKELDLAHHCLVDQLRCVME